MSVARPRPGRRRGPPGSEHNSEEVESEEPLTRELQYCAISPPLGIRVLTLAPLQLVDLLRTQLHCAISTTRSMYSNNSIGACSVPNKKLSELTTRSCSPLACCVARICNAHARKRKHPCRKPCGNVARASLALGEKQRCISLENGVNFEHCCWSWESSPRQRALQGRVFECKDGNARVEVRGVLQEANEKW